MPHPEPSQYESPEPRSDSWPTPIEAFVAGMVSDLGLGQSSYDKHARRQLRRLTEWATAQGIPLDRELILDPDTVERFAELGLAGQVSGATYRAILRRVGPLITKTAPWEKRPARLARRQVAAPYSAADVVLLRADALDQPTPKGRRAARALVALGLGAGLDGRWVTKVGADHVARRRCAVVVSVGHPSARDVVVREEFEEEVLDLAASSRAQFLVGGTSKSRNRAGHLIEGLRVPAGHPRLSTGRLRATWLLAHLSAGTRLPELARAAGLEGVTVLSDLLWLVEPLGRTAGDELLRRA